MPKPLSSRKREAIITDIQAGTRARNQIARDHGVSPSTVTKIARDEGITTAFDRTQTAKATRAREDDCRALRAQLKLDLLADAQRFRSRAWSRYQVVVGTPEGAQIVDLDLPPLQDQRAAYTAIGIAVDKTVRIEQHDSDDSGGLAAVDAWLRDLTGGS